MELVGFGGGRRGRAESAVRKEEGKCRVETVTGRIKRIRVIESMKIAGRSKNEVGILVRVTIAFLVFQVTSVDWMHTGIVLAGIVSQDHKT